MSDRAFRCSLAFIVALAGFVCFAVLAFGATPPASRVPLGGSPTPRVPNPHGSATPHPIPHPHHTPSPSPVPPPPASNSCPAQPARTIAVPYPVPVTQGVVDWGSQTAWLRVMLWEQYSLSHFGHWVAPTPDDVGGFAAYMQQYRDWVLHSPSGASYQQQVDAFASLFGE